MSVMGYAQVGIGTSVPSADAALEISNTAKGFLMPRMTTSARTSIGVEGLQVYDTDTNTIWFYNDSQWIEGAGGVTLRTNTDTAAAAAGTLRYDGTDFWGYDGSNWVKLN